MFLFCLVFAMFCARLFICALWSPAGKGLTSWLSFVVSTVSLSLSHLILGQVWYLIVSIPDLCTLTYFYCCLLIFFKIIFFKKKSYRNTSECQMTWIQIRNDAKVISILQKLPLARKELIYGPQCKKTCLHGL